MAEQRLGWPGKAILAAEALIALAAARLVLHRTTPGAVLALNRAAAARALPHPDAGRASQACNAVARAMPWVVRRVPWRADCLVQALAGQRMLRRRGIASRIVVGTARHTDGRLDAHAWLVWGDRVVLGGDIARFEPLLGAPVQPPTTA
jgi:hypothetical protein